MAPAAASQCYRIPKSYWAIPLAPLYQRGYCHPSHLRQKLRRPRPRYDQAH